MTYDVPTMVEFLKKRVVNENALTNSDAEYVSDIEEVLNLFVNTELGTSLSLDSTKTTFVGDTEITDLLFGAILLRTEIHILDRKLEYDIEYSIIADTPAGRINTSNKAGLRAKLKRDELYHRYWKLADIYSYGFATGKSVGLDIAGEIVEKRI